MASVQMTEVVATYTRAQAIADGVLVDVSATAKECGFRFPVALSRAVFAEFVVVPPRVECQDESGRLWDVLWMARNAIRRAAGPSGRVEFVVYVRNTNRRPKPVVLVIHCGPGDHAEPVLTITTPAED